MAEFNALLLFLKQYSVAFMFVVFVLLVASVLWPGRGARFAKDAMIPLEDDDEKPARPARESR